MISRRALLGALSLGALARCASGSYRFEPPPPAPEDNSLGAGDIFAVRVFNEAELSQDYRVSQDGTIDFPYIGRVQVTGLDGTQVAERIRTELERREILRNPQVSVMVREFNSRRISVLGQVQRPGTFPFEQNMTIIQAITVAGGFTALADQAGTRLTRRTRSGQRAYRIPVDQIAEGRISNVSLAPGDIVFVPERAF